LYFPNPETTLASGIRFTECIRAAQNRSELCLGVILSQHWKDSHENFGIRLAPQLDTVFQLKEHDSLIVLAEDDT
ncbi:MAG: hypothetical protein ACO3NK_13845, partial [Prochlorotrichaceae cyanobacterium]